MFKKLNDRSKTEMKILSLLLNQDEELHQREIARKAKVSLGSANHILRKLLRENLVELRRVGNLILYKSNDKSPIVRQLKINATVEFLENEILKKIKPLSKRIVLFGSCASGTNTAESDIDLFILSSEGEKISDILMKYSKISPIILNSVEYSNLSDRDKPLYERINKGIVLWEG